MATHPSRLLVRADASTSIGTGHVMRSFALCQAWQDQGGEAGFAAAQMPAGLEQRLKEERLILHRLEVVGGTFEDVQLTAKVARSWEAEWVVLDGYQFSGCFQRLLKDAGLGLLVIDDYGHAEHYWADAVLNQNLHAREGLYRNREPGVRLLLGPRYALLRREFWKWRDQPRHIPEVAGKLLVTLGGSDPDNATLKVVRALAALGAEQLETVVVVGGSNPHLPALRAGVAALTLPIRVETDVTDMAGLMAWADLAVTAGGSTSWELAFMGLPALVLVLADNQVDVAAGLARHGVARDLGWHTALDIPTLAGAIGSLVRDCAGRQMLNERGRQLVDGQGGQRVIQALREMRP
jgi:UDP-2,4-diacetamido-2,4,6-trideoxy-beta-L-altropyranose hydrolase